MRIDIENRGNNLQAGDLIILDNGEMRLVVSDDWHYGCVDLKDGEVTSRWYPSIADLLRDYSIVKVIPGENLILKTV